MASLLLLPSTAAAALCLLAALATVIQSSASSNSPVRLISAERTPTATGDNRFTVRFTQNAETLKLRVYDNRFPEREPHSVGEEADGVWAASFTVEPITTDGSNPWFLIGNEDLSQMILLELNNWGSSAASQDIVELPELHLDPPQEAVYQPGQDVLLQGFVPRNSETGEVVSNMHRVFQGVDLDTGEFFMHRDADRLSRTGQVQVSEDGTRGNMTILTSEYHLAGYFKFITFEGNTGGQLVPTIMVMRDVLVRPADQSGPFPTGYLSIAVSPHGDKSPNGNELKVCSVGEQCLVSCIGVGDTISEFDVRKIAADGSMEPVDTPVLAPALTAHYRTLYWTAPTTEAGTTTFQCRVSDLTHGTVATTLVDVVVH